MHLPPASLRFVPAAVLPGRRLVTGAVACCAVVLHCCRAAVFLGLVGLPVLGAELQAQERFTQQIILVPPFDGDRRLGNVVADRLRPRLQALYRKREVEVLDEWAMEQLLEKSSITPTMLDSSMARTVARQMRADEFVQARVERTATGRVKVHGRLALVRDRRLFVPLPDIEAPTADSAASMLTAAIAERRKQLIPHRRCENGVREGKFAEAIRAARESAQALKSASLLRGCLVNALAFTGTDAREVLAEVKPLLAEHPDSWAGLDASARAYDALGDTVAAAQAWLALAATDSSDLVLSRRVITALLADGNARSALPLVVARTAAAPDDMDLLRLLWQARYAVRDWSGATEAGERLLRGDPVSLADSSFALRLATAHRLKGDTVRAVALAADGVGRFPKDARLYVLYSDLVQGDSRNAVDRGLTRFPDVAELHLMRAQELKRQGKVAESAAPLQRALALDPSLGQGYLALAQVQSDLGMADSALVSLHEAVTKGEPAAEIAAFALSRGNALYRAANGTKQRPDWQRALAYLAFADSLRHTPQATFLTGATALAISQSAAAEAPTTRACELSRLASSLVPLAREKITAGAEVAPDASRQYLAYLDQLEPVVAQQIASLCAPG